MAAKKDEMDIGSLLVWGGIIGIGVLVIRSVTAPAASSTQPGVNGSSAAPAAGSAELPIPAASFAPDHYQSPMVSLPIEPTHPRFNPGRPTFLGPPITIKEHSEDQKGQDPLGEQALHRFE